MSNSNISYFIGLDLGQAAEYSAVAVLERSVQRDPSGGWAWHYDVRHLERFALETRYKEVQEWLANRLRRPPLEWATLVIDQTSVGRPVVDAFRRADLHASMRRMVVTGAHEQSYTGGLYSVPKRELATVLQLVLQGRRLHIANSLEHAQTLSKELAAFRPKVRLVRDDTLDAWRERDHDDLVLAVAIAVWMSERRPAAGPEDSGPSSAGAWWEQGGWEMIFA
jgi:hypothetical protein